MRISYNWLRELLPDLTHSPAELAQLLTTHSFETVVSQELGLDSQVTVVKIEKLEPHPNADRLRLATITDGKNSTTVVCGAPNIAEGDIVPFSPPGTKLINENGEQFVLKEAVIRGTNSPGMLNSLRELGLGTSHSGIFILPMDLPLGSKVAEHLPADTILECDITPNRAHDCLSHLGVAREVAAILKLELHEPARNPIPTAVTSTPWSVAITQEHTPRYVGVELQGISATSSPMWLQARLLALGARPINVVVDCSNYVMFETGNPTHAYDADKLPDKTISVRWAQAGEFITTLDGVVQTLVPENLVVTSGDVPVALAGVMGGAVGEVTSDTTNLIIEVANFKPYAIFKSASALGLRTEASIRFSKGLDPSVAATAASRLVQLLQELTHAQVTFVTDYYPNPMPVSSIPVRPAKISEMAGMAITDTEAVAALKSLRLSVDQDNAVWEVQPPSERIDIVQECDVIEEIIRVVGLPKITAKPPTVETAARISPAILWREAVRDILVQQDFTETYNYSFENAKIARGLGMDLSRAVTITNPVAPELKYLRISLLPALLANLLKNKAEFRAVQLFEVGIVFETGAGGSVEGVLERHMVAGICWHENTDPQALNPAIVQLFSALGVSYELRQPDASQPWWDQQAQQIVVGSEIVGHYGSLASSVLSRAKIKVPAVAFELNLDALAQLAANNPQPFQLPSSHAVTYMPFSKYPPVWRDVSLLVESAVTPEAIEAIMRRVGADLVADVELFDVYEPTVPSEKGERNKSVAFHIKYQARDKTLTDSEIDPLHNEIIATLEREINAKSR